MQKPFSPDALRAMLQHSLPLVVRPYRPAQLLVQRVRELLTSQPELMLNADGRLW